MTSSTVIVRLKVWKSSYLYNQVQYNIPWDNNLIEENPTVSDQDTTGQDTSDFTDGSYVSPPSTSSDTVQKKNLRKRKGGSETSDDPTPHKMDRA